MKNRSKVFFGLVCLLFTAGMIAAESNISTKAGVRVLISGEIGGVFNGGDAEYSGGLIGGLFFAPYKKLSIANVPVSTYGTTVLKSGFKGFTLPNLGDLDPFKMLERTTESINKSMQLQESFNDGKITQESYDASRNILDKETALISAELNAVVTESSFSQLEKVSFGIISGYYGTSYVEETTDRWGHVKHDFMPFSYVPIMASFQHNFYALQGNMRHIYTKVEIPYETPKTLTWSYHNLQSNLFYRISGGAGLIQETPEIAAGFAPVFRIETGLSSRKEFLALNMSIGYQQLITNFNAKGTLFINLCILL